MVFTEVHFRGEWPSLARHLPHVSAEARLVKPGSKAKCSADYEAYPLFRDIALLQEKEIAGLRAELARTRSGIVPKDWWKKPTT